MDKWLVVTEQNWVLWVAGLFALFEFFRWVYSGVEWLCKTFGIETKGMREKRKWDERLEKVENAIKEIKDTSKHNVNMFLDHEKQVVERVDGIKDTIIEELNKLHIALDKQKEEMDDINNANIKTDCAMLRDRITSGMRYFSQHRDGDGNVHISFSDYENMEALFQRYFARGGNGTIKKMYESEFKNFIIDQ